MNNVPADPDTFVISQEALMSVSMKILIWMMILMKDECVLMELNFFLGISVLVLIELESIASPYEANVILTLDVFYIFTIFSFDCYNI